VGWYLLLLPSRCGQLTDLALIDLAHCTTGIYKFNYVSIFKQYNTSHVTHMSSKIDDYTRARTVQTGG